MDQRIQSILTSISELEDRYADLLTSDAPERELAFLWSKIRELRRELEQLKKTVPVP